MNPSALAAIQWELETSTPGVQTWGELVETFATRLSPVGPIEIGLKHAKQEAGHAEQYRGAGGQYVLMTMDDSSFKIVLDLAGHGVTTEGTPTVDPNETFISWVLGGLSPDVSLATSQTLTGGTKSIPLTSGANGVDAGGLVCIGTLGDGAGDAQMYPVASHAANALHLLVDLRADPAAAQKVFPVWQSYLPSDPTVGAVQSARFRLQTANMQYSCHGCFPMAATIKNTGPSGRPQLEATIGVARWTEVAATFPNVLTPNKLLPAPVAAGSLHVNTIVDGVYTTARNELYCHAFDITYSMKVEVLKGPGGFSPYQSIIGARRVVDDVQISFTVDADAASTTPLLPGWGRGTTSFGVMYTLSTTPGNRIAFWFPKVCSMTVPIQMADSNINRFKFEGSCYTSDTLTTELTRSRMIYGSA